MTSNHYIDGFLAAVPTANKDAYRQYAATAAALFKEFGALQVVECWGEDVPQGQLTSMPLAVQCKDDETVVFSWIIWPDKATRDAGWQKVTNDPRIPQEMPFDGKRLIYGGFVPLVVEGKTA
ncbi:RNA signal recognition particle [Lysobacteraceae bacterium NML120232]|nr:RNA signal recognition particle [Xanthomonadaceae bacterium NML120232]